METLDLLARKLRKHLLSFLVLQGVGFLGLVILLVFFPGSGNVLGFTVGIISSIYMFITTLMNLRKLEGRKKVSLVAPYIFAGLKIFDILVPILVGEFSGLEMSIFMLIWNFYIIHRMKEYNAALEQVPTPVETID